MDTNTSFGINHPSVLHEIIKSCEKLVTETIVDLEIYRKEQQKLQQHILEVQEENNRINSKLEGLKNGLETNDPIDDGTRQKITNEAFENIKKQIEYLRAENYDLRQLHKSNKAVIDNLEKETQHYRNELHNSTSACEIKQKYAVAIQCLERTVTSQKSEINDHVKTIETLFAEKRLLKEHICKLKSTIEEKDTKLAQSFELAEAFEKLQTQLKESLLYNKDLQKSLKASKQTIEERIEREQNALQKVQEALTVAESAVADKEDALKRIKVLEEECDNIASTIGQVMDEAASNVEKNINTMKSKFAEKEKALTEEKNKLNAKILNHKKLNEILNAKCNQFSQKYRDIEKNNAKLEQQLEVAAKAIKEMGQKIRHIETFSKSSENKSDDHEKEIKYYMHANKSLHEKYRQIQKDLNQTFQNKYYLLTKEVDNLKAENKELKSKIR